MLRTQEAAFYGIGAEGIAELCEAICLDAIEVTSAIRASIWFFNDHGDMICQHLVDGHDGRIQQGAVIPRAATLAYLKAAVEGRSSVLTDQAPSFGAAGDDPDGPCKQIDLLLVDARNNPTAIFRCERSAAVDDWRARDFTILRNLAQALAGAIRREAREMRAARPSSSAMAAVGTAQAIGSRRLELAWLQIPPEQEIRLPVLPIEPESDDFGPGHCRSEPSDYEIAPLADDDEL